MKKRFPWKENSVEYLKDNYGILSAEAIAKNLNISPRAVFMKAWKLELKGRPNGSWNMEVHGVLSEEDYKFLTENYTKYGAKYCAKKLNKKIGTIQKNANKILGLKVDRPQAIRNNIELMGSLRNHAKNVLGKYVEAAKIFKTKEDKNKVLTLYVKGLSCNEIAKMYNCSKSPVLGILKNVHKRKSRDYANHCSKNQGSGEKHHSWKGGYKSVYDRMRDLKVYWQWRNEVLNRDNKVCIKCESPDNIEIHHIIILKSLIDQYCEDNNKLVKELEYEDLTNNFFFDSNNGETLCKDCHREHHKIYGR